MKTILKIVLAFFVVGLLLYSCKQGEAHAEKEMVESAAAPQADSASSTVASPVKNPERKFVRTADLKFKVKNVIQSTNAIENVTRKFGGFVSYTDLKSTIDEKQSTKISQDSTLETTKYTVDNNITIRVPNTQLDTVLKTIAKEIDFLDARFIKADDVSLQMLANQWAQKRSATHQNRLAKAIDTKGKKLTQIVDAENTLDQKKEESDATKLQNFSLNDQVNFSTLTLEIYQRATIKHEIIPNEKDPAAYRPHFGLQLIDSFQVGWSILESMLAFVVQMWSLILIGCALVFGIKKYAKK